MSDENVFTAVGVVVSAMLALVLCTCATLPSSRASISSADTQGAHEDTPASFEENSALVFESILLKRRNWENHGTDTIINADGTFVVSAQYLGKSRKVREGKVSADDLRNLIETMEIVDVFAQDDEYKAPFKTKYEWWGYQLTIKANRQTKTIRFHSEDETVPEGLVKIVEMIKGIAK